MCKTMHLTKSYSQQRGRTWHQKGVSSTPIVRSPSTSTSGLSVYQKCCELSITLTDQEHLQRNKAIPVLTLVFLLLISLLLFAFESAGGRYNGCLPRASASVVFALSLISLSLNDLTKTMVFNMIHGRLEKAIGKAVLLFSHLC